jgi:citrate synthase
MLIRQSIKAVSGLVTAREAAAILDVKLPTLYAYVSRGQLVSAPGLRGPSRLYRRDEVERLKARHRARSGHGAVAAGALRFGEPSIESAITDITAVGPRYRGHAAVDLAAAGAGFEAVAELLWRGELPDRCRWDPAPRFPVQRLARLVPRGASPVTVLPLVVSALALGDPARFDASLAADIDRARALIRRMAAALALARGPAETERALAQNTVAATVAVALGRPATPAVVRAIDQLLVLCADHELNASSFAARVAASTGADLYACVGAALGALSGPRHGGAPDRVEALVAETGDAARAASVVHERARRGDAVPGFGHPLYPDGDPRATWMLAHFRGNAKPGPANPVRTLLAIAQAMQRSRREHPNLDFALAVAALSLGLGPGAAAALFAIGRAAGWIAHVFEQRQAGYLVRPRAKYVGR